jgi:hypothetical protein
MGRYMPMPPNFFEGMGMQRGGRHISCKMHSDAR